jgi:outer membrane protein assembly factor BamD (BamD/ComL family)
MKIILVTILVLIVAALAFVPSATSMLAEDALNHPNDPSREAVLKKAIDWKMNLYMYGDARKIAERGIIWFPESPHIDSYLFAAAYSAEKEKLPSVAMHWYTRFLELFPEHPWRAQVEERLKNLLAEAK